MYSLYREPHDIEWRIPSDAGDYLDGPRKPIYRHPLFVLDDGTVIDRSKPGPFADDVKPA